MAIQLIVGQGVTHNRIFLRKCARWSNLWVKRQYTLIPTVPGYSHSPSGNETWLLDLGMMAGIPKTTIYR
jgi:hypothetical protein